MIKSVFDEGKSDLLKAVRVMKTIGCARLYAFFIVICKLWQLISKAFICLK